MLASAVHGPLQSPATSTEIEPPLVVSRTAPDTRRNVEPSLAMMCIVPSSRLSTVERPRIETMSTLTRSGSITPGTGAGPAVVPP